MERPARPDPRPNPLARRIFRKGRRLNREKRFYEAIAAFEAAVALEPRYADAHNGLGVAHHGVGRVEAAVAAYRRALKIDPAHAKAHNNLGTAHMGRNEVGLAMAAYHRALGLNRFIPKFRVNLAFAQLLRGDFPAGFRNYESRWAAGEPWSGRSPGKAWRGERPLKGRSILLHSEQGFGDMIQFVRFVPRVVDLGARVHLEAKPQLRRLFQASFPQIEAIHVSGEPLPRCDEYCPVPSLPRALGVELSTIPSQVPYLRAPERCRGARISLAPGTPRIGIAWSGSLEHDDDRNRSIPFEHFREILRGSTSRFVSLQKDVRARDRAALAATPAVANFMDRIGDFADTAALIEKLDLVVCVDTSIAHLAGALGKPVWLLLPFAPDWRWMLDRSDSPWYPLTRLFRQPRAGDWDSVFTEVRAELRARYPSRRADGGRARPRPFSKPTPGPLPYSAAMA
ncbi:MAG TPA: tetratricopeptide repeat protein [Dongiaceae bacterium]|nr:tetratricopeptide repeat protein [Dongiaceae bacterium]